MTRFVYILSTYQENGAENVIATLDRTKLHGLLTSYFKPLAHEHERLAELMAGNDDELSKTDGHYLSNGWGGIELHVVELK
jgi:hypothetical protein